MLNIYFTIPRRFQSSEVELLQTFANHAAVAISNVRVHEQILAMEEQLQVSDKLSSLGELAAGLAHEIRNPLAVINMLVHSWKTAPPASEDFAHDVDVVAQKIEGLNGLVSDLLNLAKSRAFDPKPVNFDDLIDRLFRLLRHRIHHQRITVEKRIHVTNPVVTVDRERIEQAIVNLLLNALDVTPENGTITITLSERQGQFAIDIADSGPGIPEHQTADLFKAFFTTKQKGTGLGLPMTRRIVEEHKGTITLSRNGGAGATFTILLPKLIEE